MKNRLEHQRQLTLAREQHSQSMILPHLTLSPQPSTIMTHPPHTDTYFLSHVPPPSLPTHNIPYPRNVTEDINYVNPAGQVPLMNSTIPYAQQGKSEPQLIIFD